MERNYSVEITLTPDCITLLLNFVGFYFLFSLMNFIAIYFTYYNFHLFKVVFSVLTEVCNHHCNLTSKYFLRPKEQVVSTSAFPSIASGNYKSTLHHYGFEYSVPFRSMKSNICYFPLSLFIQHVCKVHLCFRIYQYLLLFYC